MSGCHRSCRHRSFVSEYRTARAAGEEARDAAVGTYGPGSEEWAAYEPPPVLFKDWLVTMTGWSDRSQE